MMISILFTFRNYEVLTTSICSKTRSIDAIHLYRISYHEAINKIGLHSSGINCDILINDNISKEVKDKAKRWIYDPKKENPLLKMNNTRERCDFLRKYYGFNMYPLSDEEKNYPLAYGILVYQHAIQVYYMMSAFYHPQNEYCMAVDGGSSEQFLNSMRLLEDCFPNIRVMRVPKVHYCGYSVLTAVYKCLEFLVASKNKWKYYQYLSGVDLPLRTNHEMVRIFKRLNGSFNSEVKMFQSHRLKGKNTSAPYGVKLFKSSLSATFSRKSANFLVQNQQARDILLYLNGTYCPDETYWTTIAGNPEKIRMPGSFDATKLLEITQRYAKLSHRLRQRRINAKENLSIIPYYISRFQSWLTNAWKPCKGKYVSASCVFGVGDVSSLLQRPQLVAHKFHLNFESAAFFCVYQKVRERALYDITKFNDLPYGDLPGPRMKRGENIEEWFNKTLFFF